MYKNILKTTKQNYKNLYYNLNEKNMKKNMNTKITLYWW